MVKFDDRHWLPARVIRGRHPKHTFRRRQVRVSLCLPELTSFNNGKRFLPIGTPMFWDAQAADVRLVDHDPGWDPHTVTPFLTPEEFEITPAVVISASESWTRVSYLSNFRDRRGHSAKGYQPPRVWPAICDHSAPTRELLIDAEWIKDSELAPRRRSVIRCYGL
ncbi:hypothetical protein [Lentzea sp. CA-135723]|uniref:hypothetical protein n=1 Tax=Lentzea sp. CA-135723 TaxID=3239950 RepID=UPI003D925D79